jgi:hypothetical protein
VSSAKSKKARHFGQTDGSFAQNADDPNNHHWPSETGRRQSSRRPHGFSPADSAESLPVNL